MLPSTDEPTGGRSRALRRWGPAVAIVAVVAVVVAAVALSGGDDGGDTGETGGGGGAGSRPAGALTFAEAKRRGVDATFVNCDEKTGRVAIPFYYAPDCYASVDDNGGATATGVTGDAIKVVVYLGQENDPIIDFVTSAIRNDDTNAQVADTYRGYVELWQATYQTYGRRVEVEFVEGSGNAADEVAARADAAKIVAKKPFAVLGGPALTSAFVDELAANQVVSIGGAGGGTPDWYEARAPYAWTIGASASQGYAFGAEYVGKKLAGRPAEFAGDPALQRRERTFGLLYIEANENSRTLADGFEQTLKDDYGVTLAAKVGYTLDPARLQEQADSAIARLKEAGVTSVVFAGDPVAPATFTRQATAQNWFPEWVLSFTTLADTTAFARSYDQKQWAHAFGISALAARVRPEQSAAYSLWRWFKGSVPPAKDTAPVIYPNVSVLFAGIQAAGPDLTPDSFAKGLFSTRLNTGSVTNSSVSYGRRGFWPYTDYNGIDDATEIWWDPAATGPDEIRKEGTGMWRYVDGGKRYTAGSWPRSDTKAFDPDGAVALYDEPPEPVPDYPRPSGG